MLGSRHLLSPLTAIGNGCELTRANRLNTAAHAKTIRPVIVAGVYRRGMPARTHGDKIPAPAIYSESAATPCYVIALPEDVL